MLGLPHIYTFHLAFARNTMGWRDSIPPEKRLNDDQGFVYTMNGKNKIFLCVTDGCFVRGTRCASDERDKRQVKCASHASPDMVSTRGHKFGRAARPARPATECSIRPDGSRWIRKTNRACYSCWSTAAYGSRDDHTTWACVMHWDKRTKRLDSPCISGACTKAAKLPDPATRTGPNLYCRACFNELAEAATSPDAPPTKRVRVATTAAYGKGAKSPRFPHDLVMEDGVSVVVDKRGRRAIWIGAQWRRICDADRCRRQVRNTLHGGEEDRLGEDKLLVPRRCKAHFEAHMVAFGLCHHPGCTTTATAYGPDGKVTRCGRHRAGRSYAGRLCAAGCGKTPSVHLGDSPVLTHCKSCADVIAARDPGHQIVRYPDHRLCRVCKTTVAGVRVDGAESGAATHCSACVATMDGVTKTILFGKRCVVCRVVEATVYNAEGKRTHCAPCARAADLDIRRYSTCSVDGCPVDTQGSPTGMCLQHGGGFPCTKCGERRVSERHGRCASCIPIGYSEAAIDFFNVLQDELDVTFTTALSDGGEHSVPSARGGRYKLDGFLSCAEFRRAFPDVVPPAGWCGAAFEYHGNAFHGNPGNTDPDGLSARFYKAGDGSKVYYTNSEVHAKTATKAKHLVDSGYLYFYVFESEWIAARREGRSALETLKCYTSGDVLV
mgnify:CR=1 FL=1